MKQRVLTAAVLAPIVLAILGFSSPVPLAILSGAVCVACLFEFEHLLPVKPSTRLISALAFPLALVPFFIGYAGSLEVVAALAGLACVGYSFTLLAASRRWANPLVSDLASMWFSVPLALCVYLHGPASSNSLFQIHTVLLLALVPVWAGDTAAIFAGRAFGKHPLAPKISPKKSIEGGVANLLAATVVGGLLSAWVGVQPWLGIACGFVVGILGQVGDLFESFVKRQMNLKDSGSLLPGHGGVLDRIDSLIFTVPVIALLLALFR